VGATLPSLQTAEIPTYTFKYILIEGTALETLLARDIDVSDHNAVMEYLVSQ
jgi:hypothetical protein